MIRSFFLALAVAGALFAVPAKAQALTDREVVAVYAQVNSFDIEAALLGASRGKAPSVRALAAMVAGDHLSVRRAVNALARDAGITLSLPADRAAAAVEHDTRMSKLITLSGGDFDRAYVAHELAFHRAALQAVRSVLLPQAQNAQLQAHFREVLPHFEHHIAETERVARELGVE